MNYKQHVSEEQLIDLALGNLSEDKKKKVYEHMEHCGTCHRKLENWRFILEKEEKESPNSSVKERIWQDFEEKKHPIHRKRKKPAFVFVLGSAVAIFIVTVGLIFYNQSLERSYQVAYNDDVEEDIISKDYTKQVAVIPVADFPDISGNLWINQSADEMLLEVDGLPQLSDNDYQLWIVYDDNLMEGEVLYIQNGTSRVFFKGDDVGQFKFMKASVEPIGGSVEPTGPETFVVPVGYWE
ncbi:anti-sigma factor [Oceanobacillus salinisoli]|uniref:anti-sigma factor n=1 Tax=Oceanobacillus salinisoli TaxID=2678611 RepID=UPI0012E25FD1|nr:anti-sigma factor [Oceanobacillus salinisoli]